MLFAKLLFRRGEVPQAVAQYKLGVEKDADAADAEFADRLGIDATYEESEIVDGRVRAAWEEPGSGPGTEIERPKITFKDVGGMEALKDEIRMKIIHPLTHPELYKAYGKAIGGGILMYGPPGCGKTHLARATAGEIKAGFIAVGINDVLDMWIGNSERNLHELFEQARGNKPCVLFFDEVDALGASRSDMRHGGGRHLINQFLAELDGVEATNEGVLDPGRDQRAVAPRPGLPPARPLRPHRSSCRRPTPRPGPPSCASSAAASRCRTSTTTTWPRRPTTSPAPT